MLRLFSVSLVFLSSQAFALTINEPGWESKNTSIAISTGSTNFQCNFEVKKYVDGWRQVLDRDFLAEIGSDHNFVSYDMTIEKEPVVFTLVYNEMGTSGPIGDDAVYENTWFRLKTKDGSFYQDSVSSFSSQYPSYLPKHFLMKDFFIMDEARYISYLRCEIDRSNE